MFDKAIVQKHLRQALEKAKDAGRKERFLVKQREQLASSEQINLDLTYSVSDSYCFISWKLLELV